MNEKTRICIIRIRHGEPHYILSSCLPLVTKIGQTVRFFGAFSNITLQQSTKLPPSPYAVQGPCPNHPGHF